MNKIKNKKKLFYKQLRSQSQARPDEGEITSDEIENRINK